MYKWNYWELSLSWLLITLPKTHRDMHSTVTQLSGDECKEAVSVMSYSSDKALVKDKMKATFEYRQKVVKDPATASTILDLFPRFLDTSGLVRHRIHFWLLCGLPSKSLLAVFFCDVVHCLTDWSRLYNALWWRCVWEIPCKMANVLQTKDHCKNLPQSVHIDELLLSAQQESDDDGQWERGDFTHL